MLSENQFWTLGTLRREEKGDSLASLSLPRQREREKTLCAASAPPHTDDLRTTRCNFRLRDAKTHN